MPKRKTGAAKKKDRQRQHQAGLRNKQIEIDLAKEACNADMVCDSCHTKQRNRAFCYFCNATQRVPICAECGATKCLGRDCCVPHGGKNVTGMALVGAVCDHCEAWICHSRKCLTTHACRCPIAGAVCVECERGVWDHGGRLFTCATCANWICEDDQLEHQAMCQVLESETGKCISCNRLGVWSCLRCKLAFCDTHVKSKLSMAQAVGKKDPYKCKKCGYDLQESKMLSMSTRRHEYGRQTRDEAAESGWGYAAASSGNYSGAGYTGGVGALDLGDDSGSDYSDEDSEEDSEDEESFA